MFVKSGVKLPGRVFQTYEASTLKGSDVLVISEPDDKGIIEVLGICVDKETGTGHKEMKWRIQLSSLNMLVDLRQRLFINQKELLKEIMVLDKNDMEMIMKKIISSDITNYYNFFHANKANDKFIPVKSRVNYAGRVYDQREMINLVDSALEFYLTASRYDRKFCVDFSKLLSINSGKSPYVLTVNSGSSANLLAIAALSSYKLGKFALHPGDEIITPAAGFPTTITPIIQYGFVPVFVDIELGTYNINTELIEKAVSRKTKAIFLAHTLGIPFDLEKVLKLAQKHKLWVIEDNCDSLGAKFKLAGKYKLINGKVVSGQRYTGTFGHIGTSSFYPAHQMTMGEGGAVYTDNLELYRILLSFRDWGRDCWCEPGKDNTCHRRFEGQFGTLPPGYDHKYVYSHLGYNFKITEMQAAIGVAQLCKVNSFINQRRKNWELLYAGLRNLSDVFILPSFPKSSQISPFGFALTIKEKSGFSRKDITLFLENNNIQTRPLFAGNMIRQPAFTNGRCRYRTAGKFLNTDLVMKNTLWFGVYPGLNREMLSFVVNKIKDFVHGEKK
ncbi:MAG: lipopolysaccharide biosynthesis protein RfbH [Candidatus Omnitrophota bacterium]